MLDPQFSPSENPLDELLKNRPSRQRCIRRVAEYFPEICQARELGHTWDAIADALGMRRPTLINAYNTLVARGGVRTGLAGTAQKVAIYPQLHETVQGNKQQMALVSPQFANLPSTPATTPGIVALGRTRPDKFNI